MNNTELRIGNSVMFSEDGENCIVTEITQGGLEVLFKNGEQVWIELEKFSPIELTPEIIEKAGFTQDVASIYGGYLFTVGFGEQIRIVDGIYGWHWPMNGHRKPSVKYVHELQNLIYTLTHQELNINL